MKKNNKYNVNEIAIVGLMSALVFIGTFYFKIPALLGYTHLGDCMLILAVALLGKKKGAIAGALGAGLSDLLGGYTTWVLPTMAIKASWAIIMGLVAYKLFKDSKYNLWAGAVIGGLVHVLLYTLVKIPLFGLTYALSTVATLSFQTLFGIIFGNVLYRILGKRISLLIVNE